MMLTLFKKDLKLFIVDKRGVMLTFLMPILLITLFAFAFGGIGGSNKASKPIKLLVVNQDKSAESTDVIVQLDSLKSLRLIKTNLIKGLDLVKKGKYVGVLIFKNGFQDSIKSGGKLPIELKYDASKEIEMGMLQSVLMRKLMKTIGKKVIKFKVNKFISSNYPAINPTLKNRIMEDFSKNRRKKTFNIDNQMELKMTSISTKDNKNKNLGLIQAVAGTAIMMLLFSITGIGGGLLDEKESGTFKRLIYSPIKPSDILFGKMGFALFISILQLTIMFLFAWIAFKLPIFNDLTSLILMILCTAFAVSSFGILLVSLAKSRQQLQGYSTLLIMTMSAIGGSMIPLFIMPAFMQKIAIFSVNYWGIQGFYDIFWRNLPLIDIIPKMLVLIGIGLITSLIAIKYFKKNILRMI